MICSYYSMFLVALVHLSFPLLQASFRLALDVGYCYSYYIVFSHYFINSVYA